MTQIDNSNIFLGGIYGNATVTIPATTTLKPGTVLGLNDAGKIVPYSTDLDKKSTTATDALAFVAEPTYILASELTNSTSSAVDSPMARVFENGDVDAGKLIFTKTADATNAAVLAKMKNNGFNLHGVQDMTK